MTAYKSIDAIEQHLRVHHKGRGRTMSPGHDLFHLGGTVYGINQIHGSAMGNENTPGNSAKACIAMRAPAVQKKIAELVGRGLAAHHTSGQVVMKIETYIREIVPVCGQQSVQYLTGLLDEEDEDEDEEKKNTPRLTFEQEIRLKELDIALAQLALRREREQRAHELAVMQARPPVVNRGYRRGIPKRRASTPLGVVFTDDSSDETSDSAKRARALEIRFRKQPNLRPAFECLG